MIGIYKVISPSGKIYIGQSWRLEKRIHEYKTTSNCKEQRRLYNSFKKYGNKNHIYEIIHELPVDISQKVLNEYEQFYMDIYRNTNHELLNLREAGSNGKLSEETKRLVGLKNTGKKHSIETKQRLSEIHKGKIVSEETRNKISIAHKGKQFCLGNKHSDMTKKKISDSHLGKKRSVEHNTNNGIARYVPIIQYSLEGSPIKEWPSAKLAAENLGNKSAGSISAAVNGHRPHVYGFIWKHKSIIN